MTWSDIGFIVIGGILSGVVGGVIMFWQERKAKNNPDRNGDVIGISVRIWRERKTKDTRGHHN